MCRVCKECAVDSSCLISQLSHSYQILVSSLAGFQSLLFCAAGLPGLKAPKRAAREVFWRSKVSMIPQDPKTFIYHSKPWLLAVQKKKKKTFFGQLAKPAPEARVKAFNIFLGLVGFPFGPPVDQGKPKKIEEHRRNLSWGSLGEKKNWYLVRFHVFHWIYKNFSSPGKSGF